MINIPRAFLFRSRYFEPRKAYNKASPPFLKALSLRNASPAFDPAGIDSPEAQSPPPSAPSPSGRLKSLMEKNELFAKTFPPQNKF